MSDANEPALKLLPAWRVSVFVPPDQVRNVVDAICTIADLRVAEYADVLWWSAPGIEQFRPLPGAVPAEGAVGERTCAPSVRVEFCITRDAAGLKRVIDEAIRPNHPWQVPAIHVDEILMPLP